MDRKNKNTDVKSKQAVEDFLAKGGKIQYCEPGARTEDIEFKGGFYKKRKAKKEEQIKKEAGE